MRTCVHEYGRESEVQKEEMIPSHRVFLNMGEGRNTSLKFVFVVWGRDTRFVGKKKTFAKETGNFDLPVLVSPRTRI